MNNSILPFPDDIDRNYFGAWLSGLTDGEGHFCLALKKYKTCQHDVLKAMFQIELRADDQRVLRLVQSFWQCGRLYLNRPKPPKFNVSWVPSPKFAFRIWRTGDLANIVVSHFDRFPLLAKKRDDYEVWREGVMILAKAFNRKRRGLGPGRGSTAKWSMQERENFARLATLLKSKRRFTKSPDNFIPDNYNLPLFGV